ncbi:hypothetical protein [Kribbella sp. NPDC006257]|uniref:hypothetical protein n=1 Tax=Kribbella sp. NPDC006257 TaxID=3156738 RepID=UPI0033B36C15
MNHTVRRALATGAAAAAIAAAGGLTTASASTQYSPDTFHICVDQSCTMETNGTITWTNRMASISGEVINRVSGTAMADFGVFAGENSIDGMVVKSASYTTTKFPATAVGDPNLVGGVNIVKIKICSSYTRCSAEHSYYRN